MADARINALTEATSLDDTDWLVAEVGDSEARKVSVETLRGAVGGLTLIEDQLLGSAGTFDFLSIPASYTQLQIVYQVRATNAASAGITMRFNNDSGGNYDWQELTANITAVATVGSVANTAAVVGTVTGSSDGASRVGFGTIEIPNYSASVFFKNWVATGGRSTGSTTSTQYIGTFFGTWRSTSAISRVTIFPNAGTTFVTSSRATLYGR